MSKEEVINEIMRERNNFSIRLDDAIMQEIMYDRGSLKSKIVDAVHEELNYINKSKIEEIFEEEYLRNLTKFMRKQITVTSSKLDDAMVSVMRISEAKSEKEVSSIMTMLSNEIVRSQNPSQIENLNEEFMNEMRRSILRNHQLEEIIGENALYDVADNIKANIRRVLTRYADELMYNYQNHLESELLFFRTKCQEYMKQETKEVEEVVEKEKAVESDLNEIRLVAKYSGLKFESTLEGIQVIDEKNGFNATLYKDADGSLVTDNREIRISKKDGKTTIINKGNVFAFEGMSFTMGTDKYPDQTKVEKINKEYQVSYGGELLTDPVKRHYILDSIKRKYPVFYERAMKNSKFARMVAESERKEQEATEIIQDENGIVRINPIHREKYIEKMQMFGLQVVEKEDGVSIINQEGREIPIKKDGYVYLADGYKKAISTSQYVTSSTFIRGPLIDYHGDNFSFMCSADYRVMNLYVDNFRYTLKTDDAGVLTAEVENMNTKQKANNDQAVSQAFNQFVPGAFKKFAEKYQQLMNKIEENKKKQEESKEQVKEQAQKAEVDNMIGELEASTPISGPDNVNKGDNGKNNEEIKEMIDELSSHDAIKENEVDDKKIDAEIFALSQDPKVQKYIQLMQMQAAQNVMNQTSSMKM